MRSSSAFRDHANEHLPLSLALAGVLLTLGTNLGLWTGVVQLLMRVSRWYDIIPATLLAIVVTAIGGVSLALVESLLYAPGYGALAKKKTPLRTR